MSLIPVLGVILLLPIDAARPLPEGATLEGTRKVWHPLTLSFQGPAAKETDDRPNPFLDHRLIVTLTGPTGHREHIPGFFDGDGNGGGAGSCWRIRFSPDRPGRWRYRASFRSGPKVAIDPDPAAGMPASFDGAEGEFDVEARDPEAPGVLKWGRLGYSGTHYLKFQDGPYWIKGGTDEPENFLAYKGFDDTVPSHSYALHESDWKPGDPDWGDGKGRAIIGALNDLGAHHVNSVYFLVMNIGGDGKDVWPWVGEPRKRKGSPDDDTTHYDISKLRQWNIVFEHAQRKGIVLHFVFNEAEEENKKELDGGKLGVSRKLYYREMIARFGHNPALEWNLCEEYNIGLKLPPDRIRQFARCIRGFDPYDHPLTVHSAGDPLKALAFTFGDPAFDLTSVQLNQRRIDQVTERIRVESARAGRPLPASMDEFTVDRGQDRSFIPVDDVDLQRREKLWPTYLSGGMIEFILEGLLKVDDFKSGRKEALWDATWYARRFLEDLPFWEMQPDDALSRGGATLDVGIGKGKKSPLGPQVFALKGRVYAVYFPRATQTGELDLSTGPGAFAARWYNPRTGAFEGSAANVVGGGWLPVGPPPREPEQDWALLVRRKDGPERKEAAAVRPREEIVFPGRHWAEKSARELGLDPARLDRLAEELGGRGCVVKDGYVVKAWGSQSEVGDWFSSAKPVLSTLLMFAIQEGKVKGPDQPIVDFGWELKPKDRTMTFRHLASMTGGYARPEPPGAAWSYNDFAIQLYQKTLFDRVFRQDPEEVANDPSRFGALGLEDGLKFRKSNRRISASVRDFARIAWFWMNDGKWGEKQVLPRALFVENRRPQVPGDLPRTRPAETDDYLGIGTYGGGSDHFARCGPGIYGFNWWFNARVPEQENRLTWPDAPADLYMSVGARGNSAAILPSRCAILVAADAHWGGLDAGKPRARMSRILGLFAEAVDDRAAAVKPPEGRRTSSATD